MELKQYGMMMMMMIRAVAVEKEAEEDGFIKLSKHYENGKAVSAE
jgi:hypothetical protein